MNLTQRGREKLDLNCRKKLNVRRHRSWNVAGSKDSGKLHLCRNHFISIDLILFSTGLLHLMDLWSNIVIYKLNRPLNELTRNSLVLKEHKKTFWHLNLNFILILEEMFFCHECSESALTSCTFYFGISIIDLLQKQSAWKEKHDLCDPLAAVLCKELVCYKT